MNKLRWILIIFLLLSNCIIARSAEQSSSHTDSIILETSISEENLNEKIQTINKNKETPVYLDIVKDGLTLESGIIKTIKVGITGEGLLNLINTHADGLSSKYTLPAIEPYVHLKFRDDKTEFKTMYNFAREIDGYTNYATEGISEIQLIRNISENQKIIIGQGARIPIGVEGTLSLYKLDLPARAQIARTFSNVRSAGIRNIGSYKYFDYDIGVYDSTRYFQDFFEGVELTGWANFKPLADLNDKYGKLKIGTGYNIGSYRNSYSVLSTYAGYDYKKIHTKFEYAYADGYNGTANSQNQAEGLYATVLYDLTPKFQLVTRYDYLNYNKNEPNAGKTEYSSGLVYNLNKNIRLLLSYTYKDPEKGHGQNLIMFATRFFI